MSVAFQFHAAAVAASGSITLPFAEQIEVAASAVLPPGGGYGSSRVKDFRHRDILSVKEAYSYVTGSETANSFETSATSVVIGLNILDIVTADRVVARLTSSRSKERDASEVSIIPLGSRFENLRIAGKPVPGSDDLVTRLFTELDTFEKMKGGQDDYEGMTAAEKEENTHLKALRKNLDTHLRSVMLLDSDLPRAFSPGTDETLRKYLPHAGTKVATNVLFGQGALTASLIPNMAGTMDEFDAVGYLVPLRQSGVVRLAELRASGSQRRLTMLSVNLGCPFKGSIDLCYSESNGSIWT